MVTLLRALAPEEGYNLTVLPDVRILRSDRALSRTPVLYDPGIVIVCQGRKRGYFGDQVYLYDEQHYLAVAVPVPFTMETDATPEHPLLAIYMHLDFRVAAELMIQIDRQRMPAYADAPQSMMSSPMDSALRMSVLRFLEAMNQPLDATILGSALVRELYFRVLTGAQGNAMRAALAMQGQFGKIGKALRRIHATYAQPLDLSQLASEAGMSVPTFHSHFKAITRTSPMQYVKSTRLHQARLLMVRQGMTAEAACHAVGYASPSQFNREFKRLFGLTPAAETKRMRESFAVPPAFAESDYVSSH
ncbi:AraC family transcriptional regulator [Burkholderia multivorans]|uniref:AraC family transcriptional regulator n=1 Tax=Burkholderia multivorans TaxID=87883 RepID=UPI000D001D4D|nr:AraC family transcriptional regulator [Burkholderia multivorans]MCL4660601.1 AraC family transcriptional regulator [Burkholderia multivorans]MCO1352035.1 AraC family transcriptional regulator [Burkholderia multivorans]MCO1414121.1 AraC family transcriptional regulator [Burkholderia multivorans]MCO1445692.1 AraC family transcriptional regulator [Burkholderia multivorans]PRH32444.1 AraC family transcriptional regulator [Burkholderia multivorans]